MKDIFVRASDLPPEQREAFLDSECGADEALRQGVESLLSAHDRAGEFLNGPTIDQSSPGSASPLPPDLRQVGPYKLLQVIGEGGFGTVYLAEQRHPMQRRVALKVIKTGMDTKQVIARFDAERQALAMMDHPNIARVFEAGATESGRPYFVMELVHGVPITQYCDEKRLTARQRLELFVPVCQAVQHAHQKGIIHRDIKPTNVLVTLHDGKAVPKVIDFGVAKATQARLTEKTLFTEHRTMIGTPEYMSPEQADMSALDVDTRSDVYSLGVLLYELLTGTTPFNGRDLRSKAFAEMQRVIREDEPPRPSTKLATIESLPSVAAQRSTEPRKLTTQIRGELDWIVMRCLEKNRSRRYESASALAADVQHHLDDRPVLATPPSATYRLQKFARRHRVGFMVTLSILFALCAGLIVAIYGLKRARIERDQAIAARNDANAARLSEAEARDYEHETDRFLIGMFDTIDPEAARGKDVFVKDMLAAASKRLDTDPPKHLLAEASVRFIIGRTYNKLGLPVMAIRELERVVELEGRNKPKPDSAFAQSLNELGEGYLGNGQLEKAENAFRKSLAAFQAALGPDSAMTLQAQRNVAAALVAQQKVDEADQILSAVLAREQTIPSTDPMDLVSTQNALASLRGSRGQYAQAIPLARGAMESSRKALGEDSPNTIVLENNLAEFLRSNAQFEEADSIGQDAYDHAVKIFGPMHQVTLRLANSQALRMHNAGKLDQASVLYADTIARMQEALGADNPRTLLTRSNAALVLQDQGRLEEALSEFRDIAQRMHKAAGNDDVNALVADNQVGVTLIKLGRAAEAEPSLRENVARATRLYGPEHPGTYTMKMRLGWALDEQGRHADAEPLLAESYQLAVKSKSASLGSVCAHYGICLTASQKYPEALPILLEAHRMLSQQPFRDRATFVKLLDALAITTEHLGNATEAQRWRAQRDAVSQNSATTRSATQSTRPN